MKLNLHTKKCLQYVTLMAGTIFLILACGFLLSQTLLSSSTRSSASGQKVSSGSSTKNELSSDSEEMKAVWISFLEYGDKKYTRKQFQNYINTTFDDCKNKGLNTVILHVRPFADAIYPSKYFPWSKYISGKAGRNPGFDPLAYAVKAAHKRGLSLHAWINPYRITNYGTQISSLPKNSIARKWARSKNSRKRRNVLKYDGKLYFNPASPDVQRLVTNGVKEIVRKYDVDGIHFDDYFYPNLGSQYKKNFDAKEYKKYTARCRKKSKKPLSIVSWRRNNVSKLLKRIHTAIGKINPDCDFGISPAGNIDNLYAKNNYYADVKKWMKSDQYIDYICPQIYWSFTQKLCPYDETVDRWASLKRSESVDLYIGLAAYRAGISRKEAKMVSDPGWGKSQSVLKRQLQYLRKTGECDGFVLFSYQNLNNSAAKKEVDNFLSVINN